jgi:hypothetical protein
MHDSEEIMPIKNVMSREVYELAARR